MLANRRIRRPNIKTTVIYCRVFAGLFTLTDQFKAVTVNMALLMWGKTHDKPHAKLPPVIRNTNQFICSVMYRSVIKLI